MIRARDASFSSMNLNVWKKTVGIGGEKKVKEEGVLVIENEEIMENGESFSFSEVKDDETWDEETFILWLPTDAELNLKK